MAGGALQEVEAMQRELDEWVHSQRLEISTVHSTLSAQLRAAEAALRSATEAGAAGTASMASVAAAKNAAAAATMNVQATMAARRVPVPQVPSIPPPAAALSGLAPNGDDEMQSTAASAVASALATPARPGAAGAGISAGAMDDDGPIDFEDLINEVEREIDQSTATGAVGANGSGIETGPVTPDPAGAPKPVFSSTGRNVHATPFVSASGTPVGGGTTASAHAGALRGTPAADRTPLGTLRPEGFAVGVGEAQPSRRQPSMVVVEFKRKRMLRFESPFYVAPGEHVVVAADRGEDIGLVSFAWPTSAPPPDMGKTIAAGGDGAGGMGKVIRVASALEVSQLQGVQQELEARARDTAQAKVADHCLPMSIVDAEYQFDRKKLTFYYHAQQRLDFRNLVRDLYKTFRARIWMQPAEAP